QADTRPGYPLAGQPGKVAHAYQQELVEWLAERYGRDADGTAKAAGLRFADDGSPVVIEASAAEPLAFFGRLAPERQRAFLRQLCYAELSQRERTHAGPGGTRSGSCPRGRQVTAAPFPEDRSYAGGLWLFQGLTAHAGIRAVEGGGIPTLVPGGNTVI